MLPSSANLRIQRAHKFDVIGFTVIALAGALISVMSTGFVFGINNNEFHLPIVGALYDKSQFAHDEFIQSLRFYASGIWTLLEGSDRYLDPYWVFLGLHYLSRCVAFVGLLLCADAIGLRTRLKRALFAIFIVMTSLLRDYSLAGAGGLFLNYFTHTEFANGLSLISLWFAIRGRLAPAFVLNGLVLFTNVFFAAWNALPLGAIALYQISTKRLTWRHAIRDGTIGVVGFLIVSAPIIFAILKHPEFGKPIQFNYAEAIANVYPFHFFFESNSLVSRVQLIAIVLLGLISFFALGRVGRPFLFALMGYCAVYAIGIVAPHVSDSPIIINLHFMRVGVMIHFLAALGGLALAALWLTDLDKVRTRVLAPTLIVLLCAPRVFSFPSHWGVFPAVVVMLISLWPVAVGRVPSFLINSRLRFGSLAAVALVVSWPLVPYRKAIENKNSVIWISEWTAIAKWARSHTLEHSIFLVPPGHQRHTRTDLATKTANEAARHLAVFEYISERRVWITFKRNAMLILPSYHLTWSRLIADVTPLTTRSQKLDYSRRNGIHYVVDACDRNMEPAEQVLFRTIRLCVFPSNR